MDKETPLATCLSKSHSCTGLCILMTFLLRWRDSNWQKKKKKGENWLGLGQWLPSAIKIKWALLPLACKAWLHFSPLFSLTSPTADLLLTCTLWNNHSLCSSSGLGSFLPLCLCWLQRFPLFFMRGCSWCCSLCLASAFSFRSLLKSRLPKEPLENSYHLFYHVLPQSPGSFPSARLSVSS